MVTVHDSDCHDEESNVRLIMRERNRAKGEGEERRRKIREGGERGRGEKEETGMGRERGTGEKIREQGLGET